MNKKFSTFLAGAALLGAMSANAGTPVDGIDVTKGHLMLPVYLPWVKMVS